MAHRENRGQRGARPADGSTGVHGVPYCNWELPNEEAYRRLIDGWSGKSPASWLTNVGGSNAGFIQASGHAKWVRMKHYSLGSPEVTAIQVKAVGRPRFVFGSDGLTHVDYDLVVTNAFTGEVTLRSLTVGAGGKTLPTLSGQALAAHTVTLLAGKPSAEIPPSAARLVLVDVVMPRSDERRAPARLSNRIHYSIPQAAPYRAAIGSTTVHGPVLSSARRPPLLISSPLHGSGCLTGEAR